MSPQNTLVTDRESEIKAFENSKAGVKGLVDAGITKIPSLFIHEDFSVTKKTSCLYDHKIPLVDFQGIINRNDGGRLDRHRHEEVIQQVKSACESYGCFQLINHGIPQQVLDETIEGICRFHELDVEIKKEYWSRDYDTKHFLYNSNFNLLQTKGAAAWRDTLTFIRGSSPPDPQELHPICREILIKYTNEVMKLGETIYEILSEALGLDPNYLKDIGCNDAVFAPCHYYPACPEPELTLGSTTHADSGFITVLATNHIPGLQVLYQGCWIDVLPIPGSLVVNMGNLMQLITNDKFVAPLHRVLASKEGPRISVACIFRTHYYPQNTATLYQPIHHLLSPQNPPLYRPVTVKDIMSNKLLTYAGSVIGNSLDKFKL